MRILYIEPINEPARGHHAIASFDLELSPDVRLYGLRLLKMADGKILTFAPQSGPRRVATFRREFAEQITEMASLELKAVTANEQRAA